MLPPEIVDYLRKALQSGQSELEIRKEILSYGWPENEVSNAFDEAKKNLVIKKSNHLPLILSAIVVVLVLGGGLYFFQSSKNQSEAPQLANQNPPTQEVSNSTTNTSPETPVENPTSTSSQPISQSNTITPQPTSSPKTTTPQPSQPAEKITILVPKTKSTHPIMFSREVRWNYSDDFINTIKNSNGSIKLSPIIYNPQENKKYLIYGAYYQNNIYTKNYGSESFRKNMVFNETPYVILEKENALTNKIDWAAGNICTKPECNPSGDGSGREWLKPGNYNVRICLEVNDTQTCSKDTDIALYYSEK